jgi:hypothetical protein
MNNAKIAQLAAWNNMLRKHYTEERTASKNLPGPNLPPMNGNAAAQRRNNNLIRQATQNVNGVPPTVANATAVAAVAKENSVLANNILPAAVKVNNNAVKMAVANANANGANMRRMFGN